MKATKTMFPALIICAAASLCHATDEITLERFPDADAVIVDMYEETEYAPDGTYTSQFAEKVKVLTEKGRRENSEIEMRFSARYATAEILEVKVVGEDGSERVIDVAATTKESTDNSSASENIYDPMARKLICTIPGVKVGDTIVYRTRRSAFATRVQDQWADVSVLEWEVPIIRATVKIKSPAERPLKAKALRNSIGNVKYSEEKSEDGSITRTWIADNSPQMFPEPDMPPVMTQVENLRVSTASDWKEISRWYWNVSLPHIEKATEAITNKVEELGHDIPAIYKWVAQEIRYMGLTMEDKSPGYAPHDVNITFENRYGVCRDKAALLVAMLRIAGFEAYPVLIHAGAKMDPDVPMPYFNHAIASVADGNGGYILMDPTDESSRDLMPAYLSDRSYLVARPDGETLRTSPIPSAESNAVRVNSKARLASGGGLVLESTINMNGINDNVYRQVLLRRRNEARRKLFEKLLISVAPGAELLELDIKPTNLQDTATPLSVTLKARLPGVLVEGETFTELAPPFLSRTFGAANWLLEGKTSLETRKYPLVVDSTAMVDETLEIDLGDEVGRVAYLPPDANVQGAYSFSRTYSIEGDKLVAHRNHAINAVEFAPAQYLEMRERIKEVEIAERLKPTFVRRRFKGANARVFLDREDVTVISPRSWVVTNTVVEQVLSYDGKKSLAELKFEYNPEWKKVEVIEAVVSNQSGRVTRATEREMNEFDASWVASAPRYPASKQLIVNLPGVEVGSVISYKVVTTLEDAPLPLYAQWFFDSQEPTDEIVVNVNGVEKRVSHAKLITAEPMTAQGQLWRDTLTVSSNDWAEVAAYLRKATDVGKLKRDAKGGRPWGESVKSIRDWMVKHVRLAGPSLHETRITSQCTDPATVVEERYACRLDYIRTMCALMRGAGYEADVVFSSLDSADPDEVRTMNMSTYPRAGVFAYPICRVRVKTGGFLWWGGKVDTYYIGTENEYSELGTTVYARSHYFDPCEETFGIVETTGPEMDDGERQTVTIRVRDNGAVDFDLDVEKRGSAVAAFRKRYAEMLPEERSRHYQELLGEISKAATATSELETDVTGYPARMSFRAYVPGFAQVADDTISIALPVFLEHLFAMPGSHRRNPIGVAAESASVTTASIVFPEGYTELEHIPEPFVFANPKDGSLWYVNSSASSVIEGENGSKHLVVTIERERLRRDAETLPKSYAALLRSWSEMGNCRAARLVSVRRK